MFVGRLGQKGGGIVSDERFFSECLFLVVRLYILPRQAWRPFQPWAPVCGGLALPLGCIQSGGRGRFFLFLTAVFAHGAQFGFAGCLNKTGRMYHVLQLVADKWGAQFGDFAATRADNQQVVVVTRDVLAGGPGIDSIQPVDQAFFDQEIKGAVDCGRLGLRIELLHCLKQFVGFQAAAGFQQQGEHVLANRRQAGAALLAMANGFQQLIGHRVAMGAMLVRLFRLNCIGWRSEGHMTGNHLAGMVGMIPPSSARRKLSPILGHFST